MLFRSRVAAAGTGGGLPKGISLKDVASAVLSVPGVQEVHDMHIWSLGSRMRALSCHVRTRDMNVSETETLRQQINSILEHMFHIDHTTIQFEPAPIKSGHPPTDGPFMPAPLEAGPAPIQSGPAPIQSEPEPARRRGPEPAPEATKDS